jgi:hypothetical protein
MRVGPSTSGFGFVLCKAKCATLTVFEPFRAVTNPGPDRLDESQCQSGGRNPARVTDTSRRTAAVERRVPAPARACTQ